MNEKSGSSNESSAKSSAPAGANTASSEQGAKTSSIEQIKGKAEHFASDLAGEAKKTAESKLGAGKDFAAEHLGSMAHALRVASRELHSADSPAVGYVDSAARGVESISDYFQTRTLSQLVGDIESYARREPAVFLGGAFFAGMLGGRFLKAASPTRSTAQGGASGQSSTGPRRALPSPGQNGDQSERSNGNEGHGRQGKEGSSAKSGGAQGHESSRGQSGTGASSPSSGSASPSASGSSSSSPSSGSSGTKNASSPPGGTSSSSSSTKPSGEAKSDDLSKKNDKGPGGV